MKALLTSFLVIATLSLSAQKIKSQDVPAPVKEAFSRQHPAVSSAKWEKEGSEFEAEYHENNIEMSVNYDASGTMLRSETEIAVSDLPAGIQDYVTKNLSGKSIKEAAKITEASGTITYEAEVGGHDYIFDSQGQFLKKED